MPGLKFNARNIAIAAIVTTVILATVALAWRSENFSVEYERANDNSTWPWWLDSAVSNIDEYDFDDLDNEVTLFIQDIETWNAHFSIPDWHVTPNYTANPYALKEWNPDFDNYSYALLDWGPKRTGGYQIEFESVRYQSGTMVFRYSKISPEPGDDVTMSLTLPRSFIQIPKHQLASKPVTGFSFLLV